MTTLEKVPAVPNKDGRQLGEAKAGPKGKKLPAQKIPTKVKSPAAKGPGKK